MAMICDGVVANITSLYLGLILAMKLFGLVTGRSFSGWFVVAASTVMVGSIFIAALTWDVSRKAIMSTPPPSPDKYYHVRSSIHGHNCRGGGICWRGVSVHSTVSQIRFQLPHHPLSATP